MWKSKLGQEYEKSFMEKNERKFKAELDKMRKEPDNRTCADCASEGTVWASINLGVFLCLRCGSIHRGMGTHVSIPKGCTGTYLWGPDELESMRVKGNREGREVYGGDDHRPSPNAGDDAWKKYIRDKYEHKLFTPTAHQINGTTTVSKSVQMKAPPVVESVVPITTTATTEDLISFDFIETGGSTAGTGSESNKQSDPPDFFSEFGL